MKVDKDENPLTVAEVFRSLTDGIWSDVPTKPDGKTRASLGDPPQFAARAPEGPDGAGARPIAGPGGRAEPGAAHLKEIADRIAAVLNDKAVTVDETTRAHLDECKEAHRQGAERGDDGE